MKKKDLGIRALQEQINRWIQTHGVRYFAPLTNLGILTEEVGELARLMVRSSGEQSWRKNTKPSSVQEALEEELSDIIWVVCCLANQHHIDLSEALSRNIEKKTRRDITRHKNNPKLK